MNKKPISNDLFSIDFDQKPWANHQAFFKFLADFEGNFLDYFVGFFKAIIAQHCSLNSTE